MVNNTMNAVQLTPEILMAEIKRAVAETKKQFPELTKKQLADQERVLTDVLFNLETPAKAMGFSPQFIEAIYAIGYQAFKGGDFKTAYPIFKLLGHLDPNNARYVSGLASICFAKKEWNLAQQYFIAASFIDEKDPLPYFYAAECAIEKHDLLEAMLFYRGVIKRGKDIPVFAPIVQRCKMAIEGIKKVIPMERKGKK